jgi:16S rRNA (guanine527-N7)-methyltransferase
MESGRIAELLVPYLGDMELTQFQLTSISTYIDMLLRWNARMNLTAVREPEQIVTRHFGESLFAARHLVSPDSQISYSDVGSGAGFPGIPFQIFAPGLRTTLIEAHGKKATFLREVIRSLRLMNIDVEIQRAELCDKRSDLVTLRAVEKFESVLPVAAELVTPGGRLAVLIGADQGQVAEKTMPGDWQSPIAIPGSRERALKLLQKH